MSVVITTYNRTGYLIQAIDSVFAQTYPEYEIIVVDDGSTTEIKDVLRKAFGEKIRYIYQQNQGESVARNTGISVANGEYIAFLDDDDMWLPNKLERQVRILNENKNIGLIACQGSRINEHGDIDWKTRAYHREASGYVGLEEVILNSSIGPSATMFRREIIFNVGGFNASLRYGEDWDFAIRVAAGHPVFFLNELLVLVRYHSGRQSDFWLNSEKATQRFNEHLRIIDKLSNIHTRDLAIVQKRALAKEYIEIAINDIANGKQKLGAERLELAMRMDQSTWVQGSVLDRLILAYAHALEQKYGESSAIDFLESLYNARLNVPRSVTLKKARICLAQFYADLAFIRSKEHNWEGVRRSIHRSFWYRPALVSNRGLISLYLASLVGLQSLASVRAIVNLKQLRNHLVNVVLKNHDFQ